MSCFSDILDDKFLTLVANDIGSEWRSFFINLGFKSAKLDHFEYKKTALFETVLHGLQSWKKNPLRDAHSTSTCIKEIIDLIISGLQSNGCNAIADEILTTFNSSGKI